MTVWKALTTTYRGSIAFMVACPLLALVPVVFELLQHVVEVRIGLYDSIAAAKASEHHPLRMAFGMVKVLSLIIPGYWVTRFLALGDARRAGAVEMPALWLFGGVVAFHTVIAALQLFVLPQTLPVTLIAFAVGEVIGCLIPAWTVAAALGNRAVGPRKSIAIMAPHMPWTFVVLLLSIVPLMIPHYLLGAAALLAPKLWLWPALIVDALLVGWLSVVMVAGAYVTARRAAQAYGVDLAAGAARSGKYAL
ncbi:hypothetical protein FHT00_001935 [Sphingomonas insulae]|uniref:ABC-2 type transport system permease protein n=1 Tax=Sphingomonas insulae TaxID=424800 RepID=A0ABN1HX13_9SPHN|nr:hypothetical protein [Sphingomonas insulae]NIJ29988.1 hypothetical protein [Sphingomonas insulae]